MSSKAEMARGDSGVEVETDMKTTVKSPQAKSTPKLQKKRQHPESTKPQAVVPGYLSSLEDPHRASNQSKNNGGRGGLLLFLIKMRRQR